MYDYILKKENKKKKIVKITLPIEGIHIKPKLKKHSSLISVSEIVAVSDLIKKDLVMKKFDHAYRKLIAIMIDVTESTDATTGDCMIALNEVTKLEGIMEYKMEQHLKRREYEKLLKKIALVRGKLQNKLLEIRTNEMIKSALNVPEYTEERGKSR